MLRDDIWRHFRVLAILWWLRGVNCQGSHEKCHAYRANLAATKLRLVAASLESWQSWLFMTHMINIQHQIWTTCQLDILWHQIFCRKVKESYYKELIYRRYLLARLKLSVHDCKCLIATLNLQAQIFSVKTYRRLWYTENLHMQGDLSQINNSTENKFMCFLSAIHMSSNWPLLTTIL